MFFTSIHKIKPAAEKYIIICVLATSSQVSIISRNNSHVVSHCICCPWYFTNIHLHIFWRTAPLYHVKYIFSSQWFRFQTTLFLSRRADRQYTWCGVYTWRGEIIYVHSIYAKTFSFINISRQLQSPPYLTWMWLHCPLCWLLDCYMN